MSTDSLMQLIETKHQILGQLQQLTVRQQTFVDQNSMDKLLRVLSAKQELLMQLQDTERLLEPFRGEEPEQRSWRSPAQRQAARTLAAECDVFLREIIQLEKSSESALVLRRDETAERLQGLHTATQARAAYTQPISGSPSFLDLSSES